MNLDEKFLIILSKLEEELLNKKSIRKENLFIQHMNSSKHYHQKKKKAVALVSKGNRLTIRWFQARDFLYQKQYIMKEGKTFLKSDFCSKIQCKANSWL